jgi:uncharacterized protein YjiS (DUF1127 family)
MASFKIIYQKLADWRRYRETVRELSQLSDRKLDDIGVDRNDIEHIVRNSLAQARPDFRYRLMLQCSNCCNAQSKLQSALPLTSDATHGSH